jgi:dinuclear metal center YbgI/SA1388 family protein
MKVQEVISYLEMLAPPIYQESYDNAGLIVGHPDTELKGILFCLDSTEAVVDEAIQKGCNLIIAHHPIVFSGLKKFNWKGYIERTVMKAIKFDVCIYAAHTNLDNMSNGVNAKIAEMLGLVNTHILAPKKQLLQKLYTFIPTAHADQVRNALFSVGAGTIGNYDEVSFNIVGAGTFRPRKESNPFVGQIGKRHYEAEVKLEVIFPKHLQSRIVRMLKKNHPYEEPAFDIITIENENREIGSGMIGELEEAVKEKTFMKFLKETMNTPVVRHTRFLNKKIKKIAVCGGSGSFLLNKAISRQADIFITADFKYHQFFDANDKIIIADIGHFESEQFTIDLFYDYISKKFSNFALHKTEVNTNPVKYI